MRLWRSLHLTPLWWFLLFPAGNITTAMIDEETNPLEGRDHDDEWVVIDEHGGSGGVSPASAGSAADDR